ncbi:MAG: hypothetical protein ACFFBD_10845 [Candidatus Hodarchaeota archaeon]
MNQEEASGVVIIQTTNIGNEKLPKKRITQFNPFMKTKRPF